jgi:hypothetical protein
MKAICVMLIGTAVVISACTPSVEPIIKQLGACKMQAIEKGFRDDLEYLSACMSTAGYRPSLDCIAESSGDHPKNSYSYPGCYEPITRGWFESLQKRRNVEKKEGKAEELPPGWTIREVHPCPDSDPLGLFTDSDCDPIKPKKMEALKEIAKMCSRDQFYSNPRKCM